MNIGTISLHLSDSLKSRRSEFETYLKNALNRIAVFASGYGWERHTEEPFLKAMKIFDQKLDFDSKLLELVEADPTLKLPKTYSGALEKGILLLVSPEIYAKNYPEGIEENSYEKLISHEIAHRLHIRILDGDEEAMGPVWFYEGFAINAAGQFKDSQIELSPMDIIDIMTDPKRGNYSKYGYVFRFFSGKIPLPDLVKEAGKKNFTNRLIKKFICI